MADLFDKVSTREIAMEEAKKTNTYIVYGLGDKIIREYPNTRKKYEVIRDVEGNRIEVEYNEEE